jgi:hypothetical protein
LRWSDPFHCRLVSKAHLLNSSTLCFSVRYQSKRIIHAGCRCSLLAPSQYICGQGCDPMARVRTSLKKMLARCNCRSGPYTGHGVRQNASTVMQHISFSSSFITFRWTLRLNDQCIQQPPFPRPLVKQDWTLSNCCGCEIGRK